MGIIEGGLNCIKYFKKKITFRESKPSTKSPLARLGKDYSIQFQKHLKLFKTLYDLVIDHHSDLNVARNVFGRVW